MSSGTNNSHNPLQRPPVRSRPIRMIPQPPPQQQQQPIPPLDMINTTAAQQEQQQEWREREHRQRTIRLLMMFLMMLLLMDEDNNNSNNHNNKQFNNNRTPRNEPYRLRGSSSSSSSSSSGGVNDSNLSSLVRHQRNDEIHHRRRLSLFRHRQNQDDVLRNATQRHERYQYLIHEKNHNRDYIQHLHEWCRKQMDIVKDEFFTSVGSDTTVTTSLPQIDDMDDDTNGMVHGDGMRSATNSATIHQDHATHWFDDKAIVYHYPWNTTGFYRGSWKRIEVSVTDEPPLDNPETTLDARSTKNSNTSTATSDMIQLLSTVHQNDQKIFEALRADHARNSSHHRSNLTASHPDMAVMDDHHWVNAIQIQDDMIRRLQYRHQVAAIVPLPYGLHLRLYNADNDLGTTDNHEQNKNISHRLKPKLRRFLWRKSKPIQDQLRENESSTTISTTPSTVVLDQRNNDRQAQQQRRIAGMNEYSSKDILSLTMSSTERKSTQYQSDDAQSLLQISPPTITLTRDDGRAAFQLFGKRIAGMKELSYVSGFLKLYDSTAAGYSTRKDVLLRVQGVLLHSIGRVSLVANMNDDSIAFVVDPLYNSNSDTNINAHRRLQEAVRSLVASSQQTNGGQISDEDALINIRNDAIALYGQDTDNDDKRDRNQNNPTDRSWIMGTFNDATRDEESSSESDPSESTKLVSPANGTHANIDSMNVIQMISESNTGYSTGTWSDFVIPHPFVHNDNNYLTSPTPKMIPLQEQALEKNAAGCSFEITMDVSEVEYTIGAWKRLLLRRYTELQMMDPSTQPGSDNSDFNNIGDQHIGTNKNDYTNQHVRPYTSSWSSGRTSRDYPKEAMVMNMVGEVHSFSCNFHAHINTTALRTDWDATTSKAINYSFYMMLVCLIQIFILLRQLLHSQSQSVATRVSLICIGWQTIIDALMCLIHIYLSLAVQPLFTAFASVAFFKLLIFCVIEMKYMAIILQARNNSNGITPLTADGLRQQVAALHVRFYLALVAVFLFVFYSPGRNRTYIILALYSFWIPQIVLNVITEAKTPLHKQYIYGISLTRVIAPLYIFGLRNNFLKEVYPDSTTDSLMCQLLIFWVGFQAAILIAQGKYGARFMIPQRFLPPKFDYSRPIPASMLPPGALLDLPSPESMEDRENDGLHAKGSTKREDEDSSMTVAHQSNSRESGLHSMPLRHQTADTTRNRHHRGGRATNNFNPPPHHRGGNLSRAMVKEDITVLPKAKPTPAPVLECSICYENIDIRDRFKYMLAPCNHLYHSECLKQWMEVKMECPICRTPLPPL